jgi:hypothetical protein
MGGNLSDVKSQGDLGMFTAGLGGKKTSRLFSNINSNMRMNSGEGWPGEMRRGTECPD